MYDQNLQSINADYTNAKNQNAQGRTQAQQNYLTNQNDIDSQAQQDRMSLLRTLASMGAGGGSEAQFLIPQIVGQEAAKELAGASRNFASNRQALDTALHNYANSYNKQKTSLANQLADNLNSAHQQMLTQQQALKDKLSDLKTQRLQALNQNIAPELQSQRSIDNSIAKQLDALQGWTPKYTGSVADYVAPELSSFMPTRGTDLSVQAQQSQGGSPLTYAQILAGQDQDKRRQNQIS